MAALVLCAATHITTSSCAAPPSSSCVSPQRSAWQASSNWAHKVKVFVIIHRRASRAIRLVACCNVYWFTFIKAFVTHSIFIIRVVIRRAVGMIVKCSNFLNVGTLSKPCNIFCYYPISWSRSPWCCTPSFVMFFI